MRVPSLLTAALLLVAGCSSSNDESGPDDFDAVDGTLVQYQVPIHWVNGWGSQIKATLAELPGVAPNGVQIGAPAGGVATVSVKVDKDKFDEEKALDALNDGWPGSKIMQ